MKIRLCADCGHHKTLHDSLGGCTLPNCDCEGFEEEEEEER